MAIALTYAAKLEAVETIDVNADSFISLKNVVTHSAFDENKTLASGTGQPVTKIAAFIATLVAGTLTIDLTALVGTNAAIVNGTGLRLQFLRIKNLGANDMTIAQGSTNPVVIGAGLLIKSGGCLMVDYNEALADISASVKNLLLTGTLVQTAEITIIMG